MGGSDHFRVPPGWERLDLQAAHVDESRPWSIWYVAETGSTNADLLASEGAPDRTVLVAGHQTAGRGRLDRRWEAPPDGNLLASILFHHAPDPVSDLTRAVGVAAVEAARAVAGVEARLKWPNDILHDGRKLAGILANRSPNGHVVVGIGLNVGWAPDGAAVLGSEFTVVDVLTELLRRIDSPAVDQHDRYVNLLDTIGRRVRVELPVGELVGTALGVERDGRLVVIDACAITHRVDAGDVVHLREAPDRDV